MRSASVVFLWITMVVTLSGCTGMSRADESSSPCAQGEASYACQVERYRNAT